MEEKGIRAINQAIKLLPLPYYLILKAGLLYNKGEREEAYKVILPIRHISPQAFYQYCLAKVTIGGFPENEVLQDLNELKEFSGLNFVYREDLSKKDQFVYVFSCKSDKDDI